MAQQHQTLDNIYKTQTDLLSKVSGRSKGATPEKMIECLQDIANLSLQACDLNLDKVPLPMRRMRDHTKNNIYAKIVPETQENFEGAYSSICFTLLNQISLDETVEQKKQRYKKFVDFTVNCKKELSSSLAKKCLFLSENDLMTRNSLSYYASYALSSRTRRAAYLLESTEEHNKTCYEVIGVRPPKIG